MHNTLSRARAQRCSCAYPTMLLLYWPCYTYDCDSLSLSHTHTHTRAQQHLIAPITALLYFALLHFTLLFFTISLTTSLSLYYFTSILHCTTLLYSFTLPYYLPHSSLYLLASLRIPPFYLSLFWMPHRHTIYTRRRVQRHFTCSPDFTTPHFTYHYCTCLITSHALQTRRRAQGSIDHFTAHFSASHHFTCHVITSYAHSDERKAMSLAEACLVWLIPILLVTNSLTANCGYGGTESWDCFYNLFIYLVPGHTKILMGFIIGTMSFISWY